jgi:hypothetical protein
LEKKRERPDKGTKERQAAIQKQGSGRPSEKAPRDINERKRKGKHTKKKEDIWTWT